MSDLIERLRAAGWTGQNSLPDMAADEIERLQARVEELEGALEKQPDLIDVLEQTSIALGRYVDDGNRAIIGIAENAIKFHRDALAATEQGESE